MAPSPVWSDARPSAHFSSPSFAATSTSSLAASSCLTIWTCHPLDTRGRRISSGGSRKSCPTFHRSTDKMVPETTGKPLQALSSHAGAARTTVSSMPVVPVQGHQSTEGGYGIVTSTSPRSSILVPAQSMVKSSSSPSRPYSPHSPHAFPMGSSNSTNSSRSRPCAVYAYPMLK